MKLDIKIRGIEDVNAVLMQIAPRQGINLMRATVQDMTQQLAKSARANMPVDSGDMKAGTKARRDRTNGTKVSSSIRVAGAFYWRFLEYGDGPDGVEHAMFLRALMDVRPDVDRVYLESFTKKLIARLKRKAKAG